jgi:hypothetical protein
MSKNFSAPTPDSPNRAPMALWQTCDSPSAAIAAMSRRAYRREEVSDNPSYAERGHSFPRAANGKLDLKSIVFRAVDGSRAGMNPDQKSQ